MRSARSGQSARNRSMRPSRSSSTLPDDPAKMSHADPRILARLGAAYHADKGRQVELERRIWTAPEIRVDPSCHPAYTTVLRLTAAGIREQVPDLTEFKALNRAQRTVDEVASHARQRSPYPHPECRELTELLRRRGLVLQGVPRRSPVDAQPRAALPASLTEGIVAPLRTRRPGR